MSIKLKRRLLYCKRKIIKIAVVLLSIVLVVLLVFVGMFWNELATLASIKQIDEYGMFAVNYTADYGFDEFLQVGAESDDEILDFVSKKLLKGLPISINLNDDAGCAVFVAKKDKGEVMMARNYDFSNYSPSMQAITAPKGGYKAVSTANLSFIGYTTPDELPKWVKPCRLFGSCGTICAF